jgi:hypothetical protein
MFNLDKVFVDEQNNLSIVQETLEDESNQKNF